MKIHVYLMAVTLLGCAPPKKPAAHSTPPATVMQVSKEMELASVRLTEQAEKRLGVSLVAVKRQAVTSRRPYPGIVVVPPQNLTTLTAPITGTVCVLGSSSPTVGSRVDQGEPLFSLTPLLVENYAVGPSQQLSMQASRLSFKQSEDAIRTRINNARVEVEASQIDLRRAEQLFQEQVGSRKRVDDAWARWQLAQEVLDSARRELNTVTKFTLQPAVPSVESVSVVAPLSGTISRVTVANGQAVTAGQPLLDLMNLDRLWLRVRIPQAEADEIERGQPATVKLRGRTLQVEPVRGAPTGDQLTSSLDLYFLAQNSALNPDQRVEVSLPLQGSGQYLVLPTTSVLYDIYGGAWVYVRKTPHQFQRQRVAVDFTTENGQAVLSQGPKPGVTVVEHGAAELFGIEFGND
ncbi:MAG: efflux RND transporter periplasmic adaptor subunit [Vulcanimicrobiota bacterium]